MGSHNCVYLKQFCVFVVTNSFGIILLSMFLCCCERKDSDDQPDEEGQNKSDTEQNLNEAGGEGIHHLFNKMLNNRVGRVEKFRHGESEVCYLDSDLEQLP